MPTRLLPLVALLALASCSSSPSTRPYESALHAGYTATEEIRDLVHRYALAIDSRDWEGYRACFTDAIELDFSAAAHTPPAWEPMMRAGKSSSEGWMPP